MIISDHTRPLRSYGRRKGRKLSPHQAELLAGLTRYKIDCAAPLIPQFPPHVTQFWLEIGFGGAEHLLWQAEAHPTVGCIGCEPFEDGVVKALAGIAAKGLVNVRIHGDDARDLLAMLPDASLSRAFILFPDPWPKQRHIKRRLINAALLARLGQVLEPGAELRVATDIADYRDAILAAAATCPDFTVLTPTPASWINRPDDWPPTRYEAKAVREGRTSAYLRLQRT